MRKLINTISAVWFILVVLSCVWNIITVKRGERDLSLMTSRNFFNQIVLTRSWNSFHGGVYVPVTEDTRPNPYLKDPQRDIYINEHLTLTKINPAYMTRQISEIITDYNGVKFHITSLNPIRPENMASAIEAEALTAFKNGEPETYRKLKERNGSTFFYMAPLITDNSCLRCHAEQGYQEGDIRGGISVYLPLPVDHHFVTMVAAFLTLGGVGFAGIWVFSLKLKSAYDIIRKQAVFDSLTGIPNRRSFTEYLPQELKRCRRNKYPLSVIMCDIDHFKQYNDRYGHLAGDECLKKVAADIQNAMSRPGDFCARYGGEEFVIVLPDTDLAGGVHVAETVRQNIQNLKIMNGGRVITFSLGVTVYVDFDNAEVSIDTLIQAADQALYKAKYGGRNQVRTA